MKWPAQVVLIRHGQSEFNVLREQKEADPLYREFKRVYESDFRSLEARVLAEKIVKKYGLGMSDYETRLTPVGVNQAKITGKALSEEVKPPDFIYVSPYLRTLQTLSSMEEAWPQLTIVGRVTEDRIREQEHGLQILYNDWRAFHVFHPEQKLMRELFRPYWYQYPQGESMAHVRDRVRSFLATLIREHAGQRVMLIAHHISILCFRAAVERLKPEQVIDLDENMKPVNCGVTIYEGKPHEGQDGRLKLKEYNHKFYSDID